MATRPYPGDSWPQPTFHSTSSKGKRKLDSSVDRLPSRQAHRVRQAFPGASVDSNNCGNVANDVISCFPVANSQVVQNMDTRFVWNIALPQFSQTNLVDVFLFHGDTDQQVSKWTSLAYGVGHLPVTANDTWWGSKGATFTGQQMLQTFYFVLVVSGADRLSQPPQTTFTATQTALPNSILSSQSAASVSSASSASVASASDASVASSRSALSASSAASSSKSTPSVTGGGALQSGSNSSNNFPNWAIALLAVFGFLAFVSFIFVFWLLIRKIRPRKKKPGLLARRNSIGSESPMMLNVDAQSPAGAPSSGHGEPQSIESGLGPLPTITARHNVVSSDGASTASRADSAGGPFSAVDAAAMAAAFRNVMRKPDFADRPMEEGESPDHKDADVLNRELAEEGRDIRSVSSSRGVRVETLSETGDAAR